MKSLINLETGALITLDDYTPEQIVAMVADLKRRDELEYRQVRKYTANLLGIGVGDLDAVVREQNKPSLIRQGVNNATRGAVNHLGRLAMNALWSAITGKKRRY